MTKKIGIITFHRSYNCGSMMQTYALQTVIKKLGGEPEVIDFANDGQKNLYKTYFENTSLKNIVKNLMIIPHRKRIRLNNTCYEKFLKESFILSPNSYSKNYDLDDNRYSVVIAGSDQIWNITITDNDDAYFLFWVKKAKKIAYAPSFGARNISFFTTNPDRYAEYLCDFDSLSVRENNGKKWIKELTGKNVNVVLDPTLLLDSAEYNLLVKNDLNLPPKYIFYYAPHYEKEINKLVYLVSKELNIPVIAFNSKSYYVKSMQCLGFKLPEKEDPYTYLELIKNAELIITTSFHGTIFSSIYRKKFWIVKNGEMFDSDDRVSTLTGMLDLDDRVISMCYNEDFDYLREKDYTKYEKLLTEQRKKSLAYLENALLGVSTDEVGK